MKEFGWFAVIAGAVILEALTAPGTGLSGRGWRLSRSSEPGTVRLTLERSRPGSRSVTTSDVPLTNFHGFSLEMLDLEHRMYESNESFRALDFMVHTRLFLSQIVVQIYLGTLLPIALLALTQVVKLRPGVRRVLYTTAASLTLVGILAMRWNVVIGGQLFSKSFLGYTTYKMEFATREGLLPAIALMILPFPILWVLLKLLPPWEEQKAT